MWMGRMDRGLSLMLYVKIGRFECRQRITLDFYFDIHLAVLLFIEM